MMLVKECKIKLDPKLKQLIEKDVVPIDSLYYYLFGSIKDRFILMEQISTSKLFPLRTMDIPMPIFDTRLIAGYIESVDDNLEYAVVNVPDSKSNLIENGFFDNKMIRFSMFKVNIDHSIVQIHYAFLEKVDNNETE